MSDSSRFIIGNITWNDSGWKNTYINPKAGHKYARTHPGHESLNFEFNKKGLDTNDKVHGFLQWTAVPSRLEKNAMLFFYTKNLESKENQIVGVYGAMEVINPPLKTARPGLEHNILNSNLLADKSLSMLFPVPLNADRYGRHLVPQVGYTYINLDLARQIIEDELREASLSGIQKEHFDALVRIFEFITGESYDEIQHIDKSTVEQNELENDIRKNLTAEKRKGLIQELQSITPLTPLKVEVNGKIYKRDNRTIAVLKVLHDKCQICGKFVLKKDGTHYTEGAHIDRKSKGGPETPDNILILCPNHHKEFDLGNKVIMSRAKDRIVFELNGVHYEIDLSIQ